MNPTPSNPIHVLHILPMLGLGGMELTLGRVIHGLASPDMHHSVCCLKGEVVIADRLREAVGVYSMHAKSKDRLLPWRLRRLIRRIHPTIIHTRNWGTWPDVAVARLLMCPQPPLVFSFHGMESSDRLPISRRLAFRALARVTSCIFTVSEGTRKMLVEDVGVAPQRVGVIPNGVDTDVFSPADNRDHSGPILVGSAGSLKPVKNHAMLLRACATAIRRGTDLKLQIAGEGPDRGRLEEMTRELGIADRVLLPGAVGNMPDFLRGLDLFVLPSDNEAHPNALLEAMACGLPCVATAVGGVPETLNLGRCGLLIQRGDEAAMTNAIVLLAANRTRRLEFGDAARRHVCVQYGLERMNKAYTGLYRGLAQDAGAYRKMRDWTH